MKKIVTWGKPKKDPKAGSSEGRKCILGGVGRRHRGGPLYFGWVSLFPFTIVLSFDMFQSSS